MIVVMANSLGFVRHVIAALADDGIECWLFGGWAEELRGLSPARAHGDIDLLYPAEAFAVVDRLIGERGLDEINAKRMAHKRAFLLHGTMVELMLVRRDDHGHYTRVQAAYGTTGQRMSSRLCTDYRWRVLLRCMGTAYVMPSCTAVPQSTAGAPPSRLGQ